MANSISGTLNAASPGVDSVELSRLSRPAIDVNKVKATSPEEAKKLGQDFEAMFLEEMMRPMFAGVSKPNAMFGGGAWRRSLSNHDGARICQSLCQTGRYWRRQSD